jgi:hypothetical protein
MKKRKGTGTNIEPIPGAIPVEAFLKLQKKKKLTRAAGERMADARGIKILKR